jgi:hypothetical protein
MLWWRFRVAAWVYFTLEATRWYLVEVWELMVKVGTS